MFLDRGFEAVTVAEIAREAGVSSVTVFNHFPRKEDMLLDRAEEAAELIRTTIRDRAPGVDVLAALSAMIVEVAGQPRGLAHISDESMPFFRTVASSPALVGRAREIAADLQREMTEALDDDESFAGDGILLSAFFIAGYSTVLVENARRLIEGESAASIAADYPARLERLFASLRTGAYGD